MPLTQLNSSLNRVISNVHENFSINISTEEGDIKLNAEIPRKAASLAKLFILVEAFKQAQDGKLSLDKKIHIKKEQIVGGAGVIPYLTGFQTYRVRNLIELMIIVSDNTAANIILDLVGMENVNKLAIQLGCKETIINRKFMDTIAQKAGLENYSSANNIIKLLQLISKHNKVLTDHSRNQIMDILVNQQFTNKLPTYLKDSDLITFYHKTGELPGVEHDTGIIVYKHRTIEVAVLSEGWSNNGTAQRYFAEIGKILIDYIT